MSIQIYSHLAFSSCFCFFLVQKNSGEHWSWGVYNGCPPKKGEKGNPGLRGRREGGKKEGTTVPRAP